MYFCALIECINQCILMEIIKPDQICFEMLMILLLLISTFFNIDFGSLVISSGDTEQHYIFPNWWRCWPLSSNLAVSLSVSFLTSASQKYLFLANAQLSKAFLLNYITRHPHKCYNVFSDNLFLYNLNILCACFQHNSF